LFPFPEDSPRNPKDQDPKKLLFERGFIKGYVDLVLEHDNLVYLADWKSDVLLSYDQTSIDRHVAEHYDLQAKLYSLALVKALSINKKASYEERFGGMFYVFLRSLGQSDGQPHGVYFRRPSWSEIRSYDQELKRVDRLPRNARP
jgi:exodeoxyribonuclease V beta subunit